MAQMPFSPCDQAVTGTCTSDASINMLRDVFGSIIDALISGADPNSITAGGNLLASLMSYYNMGILVVAGLIVTYVAIMGTVNTANDGEALGQNWSTVWTPMRIIAGGGVLLPSASGFSFVQIAVLLFTLWGVGFANGLQKIGMTIGVISPNGVVQGINQPGAYFGMREFAKNFVAADYCARAANTIYADETGDGVNPLVTPDPSMGSTKTTLPSFGGITADKISRQSGSTEYTFNFKDRGPTNLAGGDPICGSMTVSMASGTTQASGTQQALDALRVSIQNEKYKAIQGLMKDLDAWISTWPSTIDDPQWASVDSDKLNQILAQHEGALATALTNDVSNGQLTGGLQTLVDNLTKGGWAETGGWFQRVGMVRGQVASTLSQQMATLSAPSMTGLPDDPRAAQLRDLVTTVSAAIAKKAEEKQSYTNAQAPQPEDFASLIPKDHNAEINVDSIKGDINTKMSSWVNRSMETVVDIAVGADANGGQTPMCGSAGVMGGSVNRMKCIGDYLSGMNAFLFAAKVSLNATAALLRVGAATIGSVPVVGGAATKSADALWDWMQVEPIQDLAALGAFIKPAAVFFGVAVPSMPYVIFMMVVVGWLLAVLQAIVAAPLWAVMHMTPDRTFIGSQTQGYMLLLGIFVRPALAIIGLFVSFLLIDPVINFIAKTFFEMRGNVVGSTGMVGTIAEFFTAFFWVYAFAMLLVPVIYMIFGLPQALPDHVMKWIGAGVEDLGATSATSEVRGGVSNLAMRASAARDKGGAAGQRGGGGGGGSGPSDNLPRGSAAPSTTDLNNGQGVVPPSEEPLPPGSLGTRPLSERIGDGVGTAVALAARGRFNGMRENVSHAFTSGSVSAATKIGNEVRISKGLKPVAMPPSYAPGAHRPAAKNGSATAGLGAAPAPAPAPVVTAGSDAINILNAGAMPPV